MALGLETPDHVCLPDDHRAVADPEPDPDPGVSRAGIANGISRNDQTDGQPERSTEDKRKDQGQRPQAQRAADHRRG